MALFGKREKAYEVWGDKPRWKEARQRLKDAGIKVMETGFYETEAPACGCGAGAAGGSGKAGARGAPVTGTAKDKDPLGRVLRRVLLLQKTF